MKHLMSEEEFAASNLRTQIETRPLFDGLSIVLIRVKAGVSRGDAIAESLNTLGLPFIEYATETSRLFAVYRSERQPIDFRAFFGPETLVDSNCSYGHGARCRHRDKQEYCVDSGASANRCDDRRGYCAAMYNEWEPPTRCGETKESRQAGH